MRYPLRRLRRKKMAAAKPMIPKMAPYEVRLGDWGEAGDAEAEVIRLRCSEFAFGDRRRCWVRWVPEDLLTGVPVPLTIGCLPKTSRWLQPCLAARLPGSNLKSFVEKKFSEAFGLRITDLWWLKPRLATRACLQWRAPRSSSKTVPTPGFPWYFRGMARGISKCEKKPIVFRSPWLWASGESTWPGTRTPNQLIKSQLLYQLS